ncbi:DNA-binding response regulator, OmpR family, contains REC and winged-helix (wHTH) domain [Modicisalibacter ilicicola DSM 19980]|uniref:DNA-binding response regulator, OmpR family, contains REC and winged-helix (WHTH) domain n=1 Tax=Modicisalibacter ilicicola DSM 19980 TaxID=1121942 RepID=A0A1M5DXB0_9GAMM|nr:response regulator transcription factor [Halomonas ilicicola]SHF71514.1 DNA-binding response regulator, OmpR family, contains REC and winged-helix (wHTH) domain [Halomonas ilicicola DSM 19980]
MHIGVLEDDSVQQEFIRLCLSAAEHEVSLFERASELRRAMQQQAFDLLILDWRLPDACGMDVMSHLRQHDGWHNPILFITASQNEEDVVLALEHGADDFLAKPLRPRELEARVNALGRRLGMKAVKRHDRHGAYFLDREHHCVRLEGRAISLTDREYRLATLFFTHVGELLSRAHLLEVVWGIKGDVSTRTVDTHISRLRRKLALDGRHGFRLRSIYQYGYRLEPQAADAVSEAQGSEEAMCSGA